LIDSVCIISSMKTRTQISINPDLIKVAKKLMAARRFDSFSGLLETLIREEWERRAPEETERHARLELNETPARYTIKPDDKDKP
jgi:hypothetical protein